MNVLWGLGGMVVILAIAVLFSADRRRISVRTVGLALAIQVIFGVLVLYVPVGKTVLGAMTQAVQAVINSSRAGIDFLFGPILPDEGSVFAFQVLPVIVFFASLTAVLYHLGILQWVVKIIGGGLAKLLGTTRPESMNAAANIFVGQTEAPLVIRPYISGMTRSELFAVMAGGLTTVAGSVLVGYSLLGANLDYLIAASFMAAPAALMMAKILVPAGALEDDGPAVEAAASGSVERRAATAADADSRRGARGARGARGGLVARFVAGGSRGASSAATAELARRRGAQDRAGTVSGDDARWSDADADGGDGDDLGPTDRGRPARERRTVMTDTATPGSGPETDDAGPDDEDDGPTNVIDAAAKGASDGLSLALNVGAMLLAFIALIALANLVLGAVGGLFGVELTIQQLLGYVFAPIMFVVGVPWNEAVDAGSFLGQKVVLNEFVAFSDFAPRAEDFSAKTQAIVTFALTGFANLGSLAILIGGLGGIAPDRRSDIARLGMLAVLAGTLGNLMSAAIAGVLIG
ncbi:CNT family concentrative nucleoside transporter [Georgenia soli]|uniref:CNT family concentrative nucleoside transporter n=1 Tax=Georgenia soli TaxID=638953 RepID=A0A2A9EK02_9MICO|nr:nucleoside transporter C-terminal domain-containing protein [Georgenia soli]PFG39284.1 CNT family concentrative nucleoside transporter [Georgenia soli]